MLRPVVASEALVALCDLHTGRGSYGSVYKAQIRGTQEVVAVKVIPLGDKDEVLEIQKEIEMLKECNHPNVVRYLVSLCQLESSSGIDSTSWPHVLHTQSHQLARCAGQERPMHRSLSQVSHSQSCELCIMLQQQTEFVLMFNVLGANRQSPVHASSLS